MEKRAASAPMGPEEHTRAEERAALAGLVIVVASSALVLGLIVLAAVVAWRLTVG